MEEESSLVNQHEAGARRQTNVIQQISRSIFLKRLTGTCIGVIVIAILVSFMSSSDASSNITNGTSDSDATDNLPDPGDTMVLNYLQTEEGLDEWEAECESQSARVQPGTYEYAMFEADCGKGYTIPAEPYNKLWKVGLVGKWTFEAISLSGCTLGHSCLLQPKCEIVQVKTLEQLKGVKVFLTMVTDHELMTYLRKPDNGYSVLYWREALWKIIPSVAEQAEQFDLEMGVHYFSGINNPSFLIQPTYLLRGMFLNTKKSEFAASVISDCHTLSQRERYLEALVRDLGERRVHRYGTCGTREFPSRPLNRGFSILAKYKL